MKCKYLITSLLIILLSVGCNEKNQPIEIETTDNIEQTEDKRTDNDKVISELKSKNEKLLNENTELKERINELEDDVSNSNEAEELNNNNIDKCNFLIDVLTASNEIDNNMVSEVEAINGIHIGDSIRDVIKNLGKDFELQISDKGFDPILAYDGINISIHDYYYTVTEISVNASNFITKEGGQVGDNANDVIERYSQIYEMNIDEKLYEEYPELLFDLGGNFIVQFAIDTYKLTNESLITNITLRNIYYSEY